ncbi:hypothetical protein J3E71DRAFT_401464 [Bipolaris maydis]|nr:hypothetical protein J3E71DRAFT_401464 [Bipolaris maydis]
MNNPRFSLVLRVLLTSSTSMTRERISHRCISIDGLGSLLASGVVYGMACHRHYLPQIGPGLSRGEAQQRLARCSAAENPCTTRQLAFHLCNKLHHWHEIPRNATSPRSWDLGVDLGSLGLDVSGTPSWFPCHQAAEAQGSVWALTGTGHKDWLRTVLNDEPQPSSLQPSYGLPSWDGICVFFPRLRCQQCMLTEREGLVFGEDFFAFFALPRRDSASRGPSCLFVTISVAYIASDTRPPTSGHCPLPRPKLSKCGKVNGDAQLLRQSALKALHNSHICDSESGFAPNHFV